MIIQTVSTLQKSAEPSAGLFEFFGFDIIIDQQFNPWLLEVNLSPACAERTPWLTTMLDAMSDGLLNIVLGPDSGIPIYANNL